MKQICLALCAIGAMATASATIPEAPVVTVGSNEIKQLQFDWSLSPRASRYELWFKPNPAAAWVKYTERAASTGTRFRINVSVHLLDWRVARYRVDACNPSGCAPSAEVGVEGLGLDAAGYLKPQTTTATWFGHTVAMSADGTTAAVLSADVAGSNTHVSTIHVYRKKSTAGGWIREARLFPSPAHASTAQPYVGSALSLSADGNVLAFGSWAEVVPSARGGAVYVFRRSGATWTQAQRITSSLSGDRFGIVTDLDDAGTTLAILHNYPTTQGASGHVTLYSSTDGGPFTVVRTMYAPSGPDNWGWCESMAMSGDGTLIVRKCRDVATAFVQVLEAPGWTQTTRLPATRDAHGLDVDASGTRFTLSQTLDAAEVWSRESGAWLREATLRLATSTGSSIQHNSVVISRDGKIVAGGNSWSSFEGSGIVYPPTSGFAPTTGVVSVYERKSRGWTLRRALKPVIDVHQRFGHAVAIGDNGRALIVGAFEDSSAAAGIGGNPLDTSAPERGAAWLY